jgi:hypothetical protein
MIKNGTFPSDTDLKNGSRQKGERESTSAKQN